MKFEMTRRYLRLVGVFTLLCSALVVRATTNMWYPNTSATFSGWPTNWVAISSLNDPKELSVANARLDFVGDDQNPGAYWSSRGEYFFIRMRVAVSNVTSTTFRDSHWIYIDRVGFTNGAAAANMPDYAIAWDSKSNDPTKHGLELMTGTNLSATTYWSQMSLNDIDGNANTKTAPPDFNTTGDGYIRTIDMRATTNFGYTTFIDFAIKWSFLSANTALTSNQTWRLQFGSRNDATDHNFPQDDIAGGFSPNSVVTNSWANTMTPHTLGTIMSLSAYVTSGGVQVDLWTTDESGCNDIVVYAWTGSKWFEVGRVPSDQVIGEGSNHYMFLTQALAEGVPYLLKVINESGREYILPEPITVRSVRMCVAQLTLQTMTLSITTEYGKYYTVKASASPAAPPEEWVNEAISVPTSKGWSALTDQPFMAGAGTRTQIRIPRNKTRAFYKAVLVEDL